MTFAVLFTLVVGVALIAVRAMREERDQLAATNPTKSSDPHASEKRHGCLVALAALAFAAWLLLFTFAYDNPRMGQGLPQWIGWILAVPVGVADILGIYGTPFILAVGLAGRFSGGIATRFLRWILIGYLFLYSSLAISVIVGGWYPRRSMGELSDLWLELLVYAAIGESVFVGLLVTAFRSKPSASAV